MLNVKGSMAINSNMKGEIVKLILENIESTYRSLSKYDDKNTTSKIIQMGTLDMIDVLDTSEEDDIFSARFGYGINKKLKFFVAIALHDEDSIEFYIHPTPFGDELKNTHEVVSKLHETVAEQDGDNDIDRYKNFMVNVVLKKYFMEYSGNLNLDMFDMSSVSTFVLSDRDMVMSLLYLYSKNDMFMNIVSEKLGDSTISTTSMEIRNIDKNMGNAIDSICAYFDIILDDVAQCWYQDIKKSNKIEESIDEYCLRDEIENNILKPLEDIDLSGDYINTFPAIYVINKNNITDSILKYAIVGKIAEKLNIPEYNILYLNYEENTSTILIGTAMDTVYNGIVIADVSNNMDLDGSRDENLVLFDQFTLTDFLKTIVTPRISNHIVPIVVTEDVTRTVGILENISFSTRMCICTVNGSDYVTGKRLLNYVYDVEVTRKFLDKRISKDDLKDMLGISYDDHFEFDDIPLYISNAKTNITKLLYPKFEYKKSNKAVFAGTEKLNTLIGLDAIKTEVKKIIAFYTVANYKNLNTYSTVDTVNTLSYSMVFTGNPGTCKTTVAKILAEGLYEAKIINNKQFAFVTRGEIIDRFVGGTAKNVKNLFSKYKNGAIFIDEAYSLQIKEAGGYGEEAINEIVAQLDECRNTLVIFAGYPKEMEEFINANPGLKSRIGFYVNFKDYTVDELLLILRKFASDNAYEIEEAADEVVTNIINTYKGTKNFGNGRFMRKIFESARMNQSLRLLNEYNNLIPSIPVSELSLLRVEDFKDIDPYNVLEGQLTKEDLYKQIL